MLGCLHLQSVLKFASRYAIRDKLVLRLINLACMIDDANKQQNLQFGQIVIRGYKFQTQ